MKFLLGLVLFLLLMGFLLGVSVIRGLRNLFFGSGNQQQNTRRQTNKQNREQKKEEEPQIKISRKIFEAEAGEYVDYEEIKEKK